MAYGRRRSLLISTALAGLALGAAPGLALADDASAAASTTPDVVVTAQKLDAARATIEPSLGASTYTLSTQTI